MSLSCCRRAAAFWLPRGNLVLFACRCYLSDVGAATWGAVYSEGCRAGCRVDAGPEVVSWQLLEPQLLFILVNYQDYQFAGTLMLEARCSACIPALVRGLIMQLIWSWLSRLCRAIHPQCRSPNCVHEQTCFTQPHKPWFFSCHSRCPWKARDHTS